MRGYVLTGVSGRSKSSVGTALSVFWGMEFVDGDDLLPKPNIDRMASGLALEDQNRAPWLDTVGQALADTAGPVVVGCSALKARYRNWKRREVPEPIWLPHLDDPKNLIAARITGRTGHFVPPSLLDCQLATLERLGPANLGRRLTFPSRTTRSLRCRKDT